MPFKKQFIFLIIFTFLAVSAYAEGNYRSGYFTIADIQRIKAFKALLSDVDRESLQETIHELEKTRHPRSNLIMKEAMAKTYADIVREVNVEGQKKKEWLYSMVCLNMAYLQFGGGQGSSGDTSALNRLIRQKLKEYLPYNALKKTGFFYSLD
jgi:hypothetical protein